MISCIFLKMEKKGKYLLRFTHLHQLLFDFQSIHVNLSSHLSIALAKKSTENESTFWDLATFTNCFFFYFKLGIHENKSSMALDEQLTPVFVGSRFSAEKLMIFFGVKTFNDTWSLFHCTAFFLCHHRHQNAQCEILIQFWPILTLKIENYKWMKNHENRNKIFDHFFIL